VPNHLNSTTYRRLKDANSHLEMIVEMIKQGHARAKLSQQIQAAESATENARKALVHDHLGLGSERSVESTGRFQRGQADRERDVLDVAISGKEEDRRVFLRFAEDLGFDLDAIHFLYQPEYRDRATTASETRPTAVLVENGASQGLSRGRFPPLRLDAASRVILVAVGSRVILVVIFAVVLLAAITLAS
jgi:DNA-binding FrmR family transcriptional regulator